MRMIYPLLAQILWTFITIFRAGQIRAAALRAGDVKIGQIALGNEAWPERVRAFGNNMNNQFETPILFYALIGAAIFTGATGYGMMALAWGFVVMRVVHSLIHTGGNHVINRFRAFLVGLFLLMAMWAGIVLKLAGLG